ncbi:hypothetical protein C7M84_002404 [Penaeus vannamei]|uniref:Ionotropic glutamate receptor L-glutamate and glycine-binding domain-containing protein n=1 Tax=Penaeus vannamei TaxID=6689 RepID=A0A423TR09_PENVA|nr:hypothetical protein C7M84_002404 [Penaeus vannamei]
MRELWVWLGEGWVDNTSVLWERWWSLSYRRFLRAQKKAFASLSSLADLSNEARRRSGRSGKGPSAARESHLRAFTGCSCALCPPAGLASAFDFPLIIWWWMEEVRLAEHFRLSWPRSPACVRARVRLLDVTSRRLTCRSDLCCRGAGPSVTSFAPTAQGARRPQPVCRGAEEEATGRAGRRSGSRGSRGRGGPTSRALWSGCTAPASLRVYQAFHSLSPHVVMQTLECLNPPQGAPHTYVQDNPDGGVKITGFYGDLWDTVRGVLNFTERCTRPPDGGWGALRNGSWTGMIGELVKGEADVAVAPLDKTYIRSLVVDYPHPLSLEGYVIVIKRPQGSSSTWNSYLREFQPSSWLVLCAVLAALTVVLTFLGRLSPDETAMSAGDAVLVTIAALSQTGYILENL